MKRCITTIILLSWHAFVMAAISMQISPSSARLGDTIRLTLTQDDLRSNGTPDFAPLNKDFRVLGTEHNMSYSAINGVAKSESQWVVLLTPRKSGILPIPAIQIGDQHSAPNEIEITANSTAARADHQTATSENNTIMLRAEIAQPAPFVNQQIRYTVKLLTQQSLLDSEYQPPHVEDALLIPLGDGRRYQTTLNGHEYSVDEQQYAIFPQKSGSLQITPPEVNAVVYDTIPRRTHLEANATPLVVKPIPKEYADKPWLPATQVTLAEQYDSSSSTLMQGSTLVRTITLKAAGIPAELLPALNFAESEQFSVYPEKPETHNALRQQELIGSSVVKVTYILNQPGAVTLPPIHLPWFNTLTGKPELTTIPGREITVKSKPNTTPPVAPAQPAQLAQPEQPVSSDPVNSLAWWIAGAFAGAWILTLALWWWFRHRSITPKQNMRSTLADLRNACASNDPNQAQIALLTWGRLQWPKTALLNLNSLSTRVFDITLNKQINLLSQALYSQNGQSTWCGDDLYRAVKAYRPSSLTQKNKRDDLPPINRI